MVRMPRATHREWDAQDHPSTPFSARRSLLAFCMHYAVVLICRPFEGSDDPTQKDYIQMYAIGVSLASMLLVIAAHRLWRRHHRRATHARRLPDGEARTPPYGKTASHAASAAAAATS